MARLKKRHNPRQPAAGRVSPQAQTLFTRGIALHKKGQSTEAKAFYERVLRIASRHFDAMYFLSIILTQEGDFHQAEELLTKAVEVNPCHADAFNNLGFVLQELGQLDHAVESYDKAIAIRPDFAAAYNNKGSALHELSQSDQAIKSYKMAIEIDAEYAEAWYNCGKALHELGESDLAIKYYDRAIAIKPDYSDAWYNRANLLQGQREPDLAIDSYKKSISINPDSADAWYNLANLLLGRRQPEQAIKGYDRAVAIKPDFAEAYHKRGLALKELGHSLLSLKSYDRAIAIKPDFAEAWCSRGILLQGLYKFDMALESFDKSVAINPDFYEGWYNRAIFLMHIEQFEDALYSCDRCLALNPDFYFLPGLRLYLQRSICDWDNAAVRCTELEDRIRADKLATSPVCLSAVIDDPSLQKRATERYVQNISPANHSLGPLLKQPLRDKIRIGYFSNDFREHPVSYLTAELFETHDRDRFEITAFSFGPKRESRMRDRLISAFDRYIDDLDQKSDKSVANLSRESGIDIAVDLGGFTQNNRQGVFSYRAAPIQASYIGYLGTIGAEYMDYLIADPTIIPEESQQCYTEKIVYLPCYQVNDSKRPISQKAFTRKDLGLPEKGFVFCCFNNNFKISPETFDGWMRILKAVEGSCLFLYTKNFWAEKNLKKEAQARGIDADRIIFARRIPYDEYLARYRFADLFLDTLPYNAGATASDALWAGLPVLTLMGNAFAGRVAASILKAIHLPELITHTQAEYEELAIDLARHPDMLADIRQRLRDNRLTTPLFDTGLFTRTLETAYTEMYNRYQADLPVEHIHIRP